MSLRFAARPLCFLFLALAWPQAGCQAPLSGLRPSVLLAQKDDTVGREELVAGYAQAWNQHCTDAVCPRRCCNTCAVWVGLSDDALPRARAMLRLEGLDRTVKECELGKLPLQLGKRYFVAGVTSRGERGGPPRFRPVRWRLADEPGAPWVLAEKPFVEPQAFISVSEEAPQAAPADGARFTTVGELVRTPAKHAGVLVAVEGFAQPCGGRTCTKRRCEPGACCNQCSSSLGFVERLDPRASCFSTPSKALGPDDPQGLRLEGQCRGDNCRLTCAPLTTGARYRLLGTWERRGGEPEEFVLRVTKSVLLSEP